MANAFKQAQDEQKRATLLAQCKALIAQGKVGKQRAITTYAKSAGVSQAQAEAALGLR
ncbi:hypothetical protein [Duganella vulcania]|uniref:Uncharacterized protein n=1 Tax=Duganella vulcania TaxID=2692166 RepID=A0A845GH62_9BURK|nr:hypothetical protein [Duganella vulcania]MYM92626.1 hypothetical protein [Duganella vulcania]